MRSSGFPVEGLDVFGPDEDARLAAVARDPAVPRGGRVAEPRVARARRRQARRGRRAARRAAAAGPTCVAATGSATARRTTRSGSSGRWRGARSRDGEAIAVRSGALQRERVVHFETWAIEAIAAAGGVTTPLPMGPFPERALRPLLADTSGLDRVEARREAVAAAPRERRRRRARRARPRLRGRHRPRRRARRRRQRRRPHGRLPRLHARPRRSRSARRCSTSCATSLPPVLVRLALVVRARVRPRRRRCSGAIAQATARSRRSSAR